MGELGAIRNDTHNVRTHPKNVSATIHAYPSLYHLVHIEKTIIATNIYKNDESITGGVDLMFASVK